ncbi:serine kinase [Rhodanobacter glycinis]|uniref:Serine kinase n=1 Tax=Rhodanobacter glycinis TaxID=582702 RepID=A0A502FBJ6_9GAMM|nr:serine kinase [Rhodanobacter glycinis]TPG11401.1 serine kinase [Rhodanobacter glycinis]TPG46818.1 serine kinase [Rhodanobacter glycinis]
MVLTPGHSVRDAAVDPFCERSGRHFSVHKQILGGRFRFESTSQALLHLVESAYGGLPPHQLPMAGPEFRIELRLLPRQAPPGDADPPPVQVQSGAGLLCGVMDASNYVVLSPGQRRGLVVASEDMLSRPYHLRYELIEFAVFTLAARGMGLIPLHGACVGKRGRGVLLLGASGSGKSTLALHSLLQGVDFLAEDAVFVQPESLLAAGVANYLHVQADALRFVDDGEVRRWIGQAPIIRRRSGVEKFEADLRQGHGRLAAAPLELIGAVFVSSQSAEDPDVLLSPIPEHEIAARLCADQPYAATQPGWHRFGQRLMQAGVHQLRRGRHPRDSVDALRQLLG